MQLGRAKSRRGVGAVAPTPNPDAPSVYLETFGCQMNEADSSLIAGQLSEAGYRHATTPQDADVVLINTCAVREKAEERVWGRTSQLLQYRQDNPDLVIGITGCMAEHLKEQVGERAPYVTLVAGPDSYRDIAGLVDKARAGERVVATKLDRTEVYEGLDGHPDDDGISGYVTIQRGCDKFCTFCVVPYTRGRERGVSPREVLRHTRALAAAGYREVTLLGQTVNSYRWPDEVSGSDVRFADLLRAVAATDGIQRVRFTSPYPVDFTPEVIAAMAETPEVCPQVHLPLQAGADATLTRMRRGYTRAEYLKLIGDLRAAIPGIALSTDIMVGFCGETDACHAETLEMVDSIGFDSAFMFAYSDRGITYAGKKLADDVPPDVKRKRLQEVIAIQEKHTVAAHKKRVGTVIPVLVAAVAKRGDAMLAKSPHFQNVLLPLGCAEPGELIDVTVTQSTGHSLVAVPVSS